MSFLDQLGNTIKAVSGQIAAASSVPFSSYGGQGSYGTNSYNGFGSSPGSTFDYEGEAGELLENGIVAACVDAISQALASTPPVLKNRKGNDWKTVAEHPLLDLLNTPNDNYGDSQLWMATTAAECTTGNAFWRVVWNRSRTQPVQLWWEGMVAPRWDGSNFIKDYVMWIDGRPHYLPAAGDYGKPGVPDGDCIIHFRYALNPKNPRIGWTPLLTSKRQVYGDNSVATYHAALMRNSSTASMVVVPKEGATGALTPRILEELTSRIERKLRGEGAGRVAGTSLPVDIHKMGFSPDEMAIDQILGYYERRVCASLRVHPMILGLGAGDDYKTYANFEQAINDFWMRTIIPRQERRSDELETQLFPLFDLDRNEWKLEWDRSGITALDENQDRLYSRLYKATGGKPWMTQNDARVKTNLPPIDGADSLEEKSAGPVPGSVESDSNTKTVYIIAPDGWKIDDAHKFVNSIKQQGFNWDESQHPRDEHGRFTSTGNTIKLTSVPSSERAFSGEPIEVKNPLTKQEKGRLGEAILASWLQDKGAEEVRTHETSNYPIDLLAYKGGKPVEAFECKAGTVDNSKTAQHWRLTIGEPGKDEKALLESMSKQEKKEHNKVKMQAIRDRKTRAQGEIAQQYGVKNVKLSTLAVVIDPDRKVVDIYKFDGVHDIIGWKSDFMKSGYQGSYKYADR